MLKIKLRRIFEKSSIRFPGNELARIIVPCPLFPLSRSIVSVSWNARCLPIKFNNDNCCSTVIIIHGGPL